MVSTSVARRRSPAAATPPVTREALFAQAGVIAARDIGGPLDAAALARLPPGHPAAAADSWQRILAFFAEHVRGGRP